MSKKTKGSDKPTLEEQFVAFARLGDTRDDTQGTHITLTQADKWMKQASILDGKRVTYSDTSNAFNKFRSRSIQYPEFVEFVEQLATAKRMNSEDLIELLIKANLPGTEKEENDNKPVQPGKKEEKDNKPVQPDKKEENDNKPVQPGKKEETTQK